MQYRRCNFKEALGYLQDIMQPNLMSSYTTSKIDNQTIIKEKSNSSYNNSEISSISSKLNIYKTKPLENVALTEYLKSRAINPTIAKEFISESYYRV
jgi:hypothetical protein